MGILSRSEDEPFRGFCHLHCITVCVCVCVCARARVHATLCACVLAIFLAMCFSHIFFMKMFVNLFMFCTLVYYLFV